MIDGENEDAVSSAASAPIEQDAGALSEQPISTPEGQESEQPDGTGSADSSSAPAKKDVDLLSVARKVVQPAGQAGPTGSQPEKAQKTDQSVPEAGDRDPDDFSDVPFSKHPRFRQLVDRMKEYKTDAQEFRKIRNYMSEYGISDAEAAQVMKFAGLSKVNPAEAWKLAKPIIEQVLVAAGEILPPDLRQMVEQNQLTRNAALEVSRARAAARGAAAQAEMTVRSYEGAQRRSFEDSIKTTIGNWEREMQRTDPDFARKQQFVRDRIVATIQAQGAPQNADQALRMARQAHLDVTSFMRASQPAKQNVKVPTGGRVAGANVPAGPPKSLMDAMQRAVAR